MVAAPAVAADTPAQAGMKLLQSYNIITLGDLNLTNSNAHSQGKVFVGGNLTGGTLKVGGGADGPQAASTYAELTVAGNASSWDVENSQTSGRGALVQIGGNSTGSATMNTAGHVDTGGTFNAGGYNPNATKTVSTGVAGLAGQIQTAQQLYSVELKALSDTLAALSSSAIDMSNPLSFSGDYGVYTMTAAQFATQNYNYGTLFSSLTAAQTVIINVQGGGTLSQGGGANYNQTSANVLWNFNQASSVNIVGTFSGSILAPSATVTQSGSNINGSVVAQLFNAKAEVHLGTFAGTTRYLVPSDDVPSTPGVPEPASWMTMLIGFGILGSLVRKQRRRERLAAA